MKDSKIYADKVVKLFRSLKRGRDKIKPVTYDDPLVAIVQGFIAEAVPLTKIDRASKRVDDYFVDLNDLRVARFDEIVEIMDADDNPGLKVAENLTRVLNTVYDQQHELNLVELKKLGKRPAKQALEEIEGLSHFVQCYCMLTALQGHSIPLTDGMIEYLKQEELVHPKADRHDIEGFLSRQISAKEDYEFYWLLREVSESGSATRKKTTKKTAKKKTTKKKAAKKTAKKVVKKAAKKVTKKITKKATKKKTTTKKA